MQAGFGLRGFALACLALPCFALACLASHLNLPWLGLPWLGLPGFDFLDFGRLLQNGQKLNKINTKVVHFSPNVTKGPE